ncbi:hypothetical protein T484DRAFT_1771583 [Baffinella frigidus]|nr:hypothetical protein T484DRAFT_1771583 [Cryptophyta sp. CCMP2293]
MDAFFEEGDEDPHAHPAQGGHGAIGQEKQEEGREWPVSVLGEEGAEPLEFVHHSFERSPQMPEPKGESHVEAEHTKLQVPEKARQTPSGNASPRPAREGHAPSPSPLDQLTSMAPPLDSEAKITASEKREGGGGTQLKPVEEEPKGSGKGEQREEVAMEVEEEGGSEGEGVRGVETKAREGWEEEEEEEEEEADSEDLADEQEEEREDRDRWEYPTQGYPTQGVQGADDADDDDEMEEEEAMGGGEEEEEQGGQREEEAAQFQGLGEKRALPLRTGEDSPRETTRARMSAA